MFKTLLFHSISLKPSFAGRSSHLDLDITFMEETPRRRPPERTFELKYSAAERKLPLLKGFVLARSKVIKFAQSRKMLCPLQEEHSARPEFAQ